MDDILTYVREKISCPQFGDDNYGEWGALSLSQRRIIKRLLDYSVGQEEVIKRLQGEKGMLEMLHEEKCEEINRQKAEIERLKGWQDLLKAEKHSLIKAEAIKEFAERLKNKLTACSKTIDGECEYLICDYDIDNLVKEMVGD